MLEDTSIQGRLFSLVVIRGQIVLLLFQCVNSLQIGHLAPLHGTRTSSHSVSSYTYERYLNSITVQNPYLKKAVFLLSVITQGLVLQVHQRVHERESGKSLGTTRDPFFSQVRASDRVTSRILAVYPS